MSQSSAINNVEQTHMIKNRNLQLSTVSKKNMSISLLHITLLTLGAFWFGVIFSQLALNSKISDSYKECMSPECLLNLTFNKEENVANEEKLEEIPLFGSKLIIREDVDEVPENMKSKKLILLHGKPWNKYDKWQRFDWHKCPPKWSNCRITTDRNRLFEISAVVYNAEDMPTTYDIDKTKFVDSVQKVFLSGLTPLDTKFDPKKYEDFFDLSITYKSDSTIRIPYWPNDGLLPAMYRPKPQTKILSAEEMLDLEDEVKDYFVKFGKDHFMGYTSKSCEKDNYANLFVGKLREEGMINTYSIHNKSECLNLIKDTIELPCRGLTTDDCSKHFERFKYMITADESLCVDYITRDYWNAILAWQTVPMLYGASDYKKLLVPNSYIDMVAEEDYISPSFKKAYGPAQNEMSYYKAFHLWRHEERIEEYYWQCELCRTIKQIPNVKKNKIKMQEFWNAAKDCGEKLTVHERMRLQLVRTGVIR